MITVAILINGNPIVARNAVNQGNLNDAGETAYKTDSGEILYHNPEDGAVALAHKLLDLIQNDSLAQDRGPRRRTVRHFIASDDAKKTLCGNLWKPGDYVTRFPIAVLGDAEGCSTCSKLLRKRKSFAIVSNENDGKVTIDG